MGFCPEYPFDYPWTLGNEKIYQRMKSQTSQYWTLKQEAVYCLLKTCSDPLHFKLHHKFKTNVLSTKAPIPKEFYWYWESLEHNKFRCATYLCRDAAGDVPPPISYFHKVFMEYKTGATPR